MGTNGCKPKIDYPCRWSYKVIGRDLDELNRAIAEIIGADEHTVTLSRSSKGGAYHCLNLTVTVESEPVRLDLYQRLCRNPAVLMVM
jgi:putative lipoic acid-binding regulatory protein